MGISLPASSPLIEIANNALMFAFCSLDICLTLKSQNNRLHWPCITYSNYQKCLGSKALPWIEVWCLNNSLQTPLQWCHLARSILRLTFFRNPCFHDRFHDQHVILQLVLILQVFLLSKHSFLWDLHLIFGEIITQWNDLGFSITFKSWRVFA